MKETTYGLIGRGRVATHMARFLELEGLPCFAWHRGKSRSPEDVLHGADVCLLAISDDQIETFVDEHPKLGGRPMVHFSGSLVLDRVSGLHPLMTFGLELYDLETYRSIPFVEERGGLGFGDVFPTLTNPCWPLDPELKPLYHALCVLGGNFTTLLWARAFDAFERQLGLPKEALVPFLERTAANTIVSGRGALTWSLARGDLGTARRDLHAMEGDPYEHVFRAFTELFDLEEVKR